MDLQHDIEMIRQGWSAKSAVSERVTEIIAGRNVERMADEIDALQMAEGRFGEIERNASYRLKIDAWTGKGQLYSGFGFTRYLRGNTIEEAVAWVRNFEKCGHVTADDLEVVPHVAEVAA